MGMCEAKAIVIESGKEEVVMEDVAFLYFRDGKPVLRNLLGEEMVFEDYEVESVDFIHHTIRLRLR
ncbi:CooT family nickel-binding protein [Thermococcus sp.]